MRLSFASVGVWWALFSIPVLLRVREPRPRVEPGEAHGEGLLRVAIGRLVSTFRELRIHKDAGMMLLAFLVYNDAVNTFIKMGVIYGVEIGIPVPFMMATLVAIQLVGVPFSFVLGMLADRIGAKRTILHHALRLRRDLGLRLRLKTSTQFLVMGLLIGTVQGGAQALARSLFASMIPQHKAGEMFGFFGVFDRFGGAIGSMIFGGDARRARHQPAGDPEPDRLLRARRLAVDAGRCRARPPAGARGRGKGRGPRGRPPWSDCLMSDFDYRVVFNQLVPVVEKRYGVEVTISDVVDPNTGDFDGQRILLDYEQDLEVALFVLVHLFGHTVQWNVSEKWRNLGLNVAVGKTEQEMRDIHEYEQGATRLGIALLHEAGVRDMDGWASDWWRADYEYLLHFYATGEKLDTRALLKRGGAETLEPLPIPRFTPQRFASRWSF